jgi:hypothetical protein
VADENRPEVEQGGPELGEGGEGGRTTGRRKRDRAGQASDLRASTASELHRRSGSVARKAGQVVRQHPVAAVAVVASAAALLHARVAAAALAGIGVTALVARQSGPETRSQMKALVRRGRAWLAQGLSRLQSLVAPRPAAEAPAPWKL